LFAGQPREAILTVNPLDDLEYCSGELLGKARPLYYYEITNQTAAGGTAEYPVVTDATFYDLRVTHWFADGTFRRVLLRDVDGLCVDVLDNHTLYLEGRDTTPPHPFPPEYVTIAGRLSPAILQIQKSPHDAIQLIRSVEEFSLEIFDPISGTFAALTISDREGNRYAVGTFGIGVIE
jgi:hypothetical protein